MLSQPVKVDCPQCGCFDTRRVVRRDLFGEQYDHHCCNHCQHKFELPNSDMTQREPMAVYQQTICPHCNSSNTVITQGPRDSRNGLRNVRRHRCRGCDQPFSSYEI